MGEVAVGIAVGGDPLVDLVDRHVLPRHLLRQMSEHRPRGVATTDREAEPAAVGDRLLGDEGRRPFGDRVGVGKYLDLEWHGYTGFSS